MRLFLLPSSVLAILIAINPVQAERTTANENLDGWEPGILSALSDAIYRTVYFDFDLDVLDDEARNRIRRQAAFIRRHKESRFAVTGHTDKVGDEAYNKDLGWRRANRVLEELVRLGVARDRLVAMVSLGEEDPVLDVETRERLNRRVTTRVLVPGEPVTGRRVQNPSTGGSVTPPPEEDTSGSQTAADSPSGETTDVSQTTTSVVVEETVEPDGNFGSTRPGNSAEGTGRPDAGGGNGNEPSGDPEGSIGHNKGGDELEEL